MQLRHRTRTAAKACHQFIRRGVANEDDPRVVSRHSLWRHPHQILPIPREVPVIPILHETRARDTVKLPGIHNEL